MIYEKSCYNGLFGGGGRSAGGGEFPDFKRMLEIACKKFARTQNCVLCGNSP